MQVGSELRQKAVEALRLAAEASDSAWAIPNKRSAVMLAHIMRGIQRQTIKGESATAHVI